MTPAVAASMADDHGRKPQELPWLYLDSVGQEYGPIPGWTMREWLQLGRFPVGRDLRVRLPEWERHVPLHQLYADLSTVFVLPPAWPDVFVDGVLQCDDAEDRASISPIAAGAGLPQPPAAPPIGAALAARHSEMGGSAGSSHIVQSSLHLAAAAKAQAFAAAGVTDEIIIGGRENDQMIRPASPRQPSGYLFRGGLSDIPEAQPAPNVSADGPAAWLGEDPTQADMHPTRNESPPPKPQFLLERLMQEEQLLPPPPPQPSQRQLQELLSQPQEGPPLWEDGQDANGHSQGSVSNAAEELRVNAGALGSYASNGSENGALPQMQ